MPVRATVPAAPRRHHPAMTALALAAALSGCISYGPREVSAMSAYDLCEAHLYSGINLTAETRTRVSDELRQRKEDCARQLPAIEGDREREVDRAMYENSGP